MIRTLAEFQDLAGDWNMLLERAADHSLFLTWEWVTTWTRVYLRGDELLIIALYEDNHPTAIAPLWIDRVRTAGWADVRVLRFLGSGEVCSDHLDLIVQERHRTRWVDALWDLLLGELGGEWDAWEYSSVPTTSRILDRLYHLADLDDRCIDRMLVHYTVCPYLELASTWEEFLSSLSKSRRYAITMSRDRLSRSGTLQFRPWPCKEGWELDWRLLRELNTRIWRARGQRGSFASKRFVRFHEALMGALAPRDRLVACSLWSDERYLGSVYGFRYRDTLYDYIFSAEKSEDRRVNTGDVLLSYYIQEGIAQGARRLDFLRGDEEYKYLWTQSDVRNVTVWFFNRTSRAVLRIWSDGASRAIKAALRRLRPVRSRP